MANLFNPTMGGLGNSPTSGIIQEPSPGDPGYTEWLKRMQSPGIPYWQDPTYHGPLAGQAPPAGKIWDSRTGTFVNPPPGFTQPGAGGLTPTQIAGNEGTTLSPGFLKILQGQGLGLPTGAASPTVPNPLLPTNTGSVPGAPPMPTPPGALPGLPNQTLLNLAWRRSPPSMGSSPSTAPNMAAAGQQQLMGFGSEFFQPGRFWGMGG